MICFPCIHPLLTFLSTADNSPKEIQLIYNEENFIIFKLEGNKALIFIRYAELEFAYEGKEAYF